jgi:hypothetical protein
MKLQKLTKIVFYLSLMGWFPFMWSCAYGWNQSPDIRVAISMSGLFICLSASMISLAGVFGNNAFWLSLKDLDKKREDFVSAKKNYELAEKRLTKSTLELEYIKEKYNKISEDEILQIIKQESERADIRKHTCVNGFGYSGFERNIAERVLTLFEKK